MKKWNERKFLFINGKLHRKLRTNKSDDVFVAQDTLTNKIMTYSYKVIRDTHEKAYNTREVGEFLGRAPRTIRKIISDGVVTPQKQSYNADTTERLTGLGVKSSGTGRCEYYFTKEELYELRDYLAHGRQYSRNGKRAVPTKEELRAMLEQNVVLYVKATDGTFVPTWQAVEL